MNVTRGDLAIITGGPNAGKVVKVGDFVGDNFQWLDHKYSGHGPCWLVSSLGSPLIAETFSKNGDYEGEISLSLMPFPEVGLQPLTTDI